MNLDIATSHQLYDKELRDGTVHLVAFAEEGLSTFKAYLEFSFGIGVEEGAALCDRINRADETGTIWPRGNLTALPKRFFREPLRDKHALSLCLRDAFVANRDYCKCSILVFDFTCNVMNQNDLLQLVETIYAAEFDCPPLSKVIVHFDQSKASSGTCFWRQHQSISGYSKKGE